ncbi:MAG: RagB/SusD family nutrient uptake outer membrane protein [Muribaculaceae bacterium]|nr:RagB/SusD family nutrient uptake outer membrane protein [Muribaculaceae bacterium]
MKHNKIIGALSVLALAGGMVSCADSFLSTMPESTVATGEVTATVEGAQLAINGICNAMQTQYSKTNYNQYNGESYLNTLLGEGLGQDDISGLSISQWGEEIVKQGAPWTKDNYVLNWMMWAYAYNIIQQANQVIAGIDNATGAEAARNFVKGEALTLRAHGYIKILQYYAPRWEDSRNGEFMCAVYRDKPGIADAPLCTMNQVLDLVYSDLTEAIKCFENAPGVSRDEKWQPDLSVAYGLFARVAMIKHDWPKAQEMANLAQKGYSTMDNKTYLAGFCYDNNDFMWEQAAEPSDIYYWSWGAHHAVNGIYIKNWGEGAGAMDYQLYKQMDPKDIRRQCYLMPDKIAFLQKINRAWNPGGLKEKAFWDPDVVIESSNVDLSSGPTKKPGKFDKYKSWGMAHIALRYSWYYTTEILTSNYQAMANQGQYAYYYIDNKGKLLLDADNNASLSKIPFGAQYKFWSIPPYGCSNYPFMRSTEMLLNEAEAACHNGDETTARALLYKLNGMRIPGYSTSKSGDDLLEEVILSRRIELWGEGFSFTDFKRWNRPIVRVAWESGVEGSGNWMLEFAGTCPTNANKGWRMLIPSSEYTYNKAIDRSKLEY